MRNRNMKDMDINFRKLCFVMQQVGVADSRFMNEHGAILVSRCFVHLFEMVAGGNISPYQFMLAVLQSSQYEKISVWIDKKGCV